MSDTPNGEGWWQASDLKWYPPEQHPNYVAPPAAAPPPPPPSPAVDAAPAPGYWKASDGEWYPPERHPDYVPPAPSPAAAWVTTSSAPPAGAPPVAPGSALPSPATQGPGFVPPPTYPQPVLAVGPPVAQSTNGLAVASLVLGIIGFLIFGIGGLLPVIFGHVALSQIKKSAGRQGGKGLAIAGLVLGYLQLAFVALAFLLGIGVFAANGIDNGSQTTACRLDLRTLQTAVQAYYAESGAYPSTESDLVSSEMLEYESDNYDYEFDGTSPAYSVQPGSDCPEP